MLLALTFFLTKCQQLNVLYDNRSISLDKKKKGNKVLELSKQEFRNELEEHLPSLHVNSEFEESETALLSHLLRYGLGARSQVAGTCRM